QGKVAGPDDVHARVRVDVRTPLEALDTHVGAPAASGQDGNECAAHADHAGQCCELLLYALEELVRALDAVAVELRGDTERHDVLGPQAEIHAPDVHQAAHEQACQDEQRDGQGHLRGHEAGAESRRGACDREVARVRANRGDQVG